MCAVRRRMSFEPNLGRRSVIGDDKVLAVIAARGGSKGLVRKNVRELAGKPVIAWSIEAAAQSGFIDRTIVSTDDAEICDTARRHGADVPFLRPVDLAGDDAPIVPTLLHAADTLPGGYRYVVLLQPTSPLRIGADIDGAIKLCQAGQAPACVSVTPAPKTYWAVELDGAGRLVPLFDKIEKRRQELPAVYQPNGAVYVAELAWLKSQRDFYTSQTLGFVMPPERSVDIDTMQDFLLAEALLKQRLDS